MIGTKRFSDIEMPRHPLSLYLMDMRRYKVQKREKEIGWFTELDSLYRKHIMHIRASRPACMLIREGTRYQSSSETEDEKIEKDDGLSWLCLWWRERNWRKIDASLRLLEHAVGDCARDESDRDELRRTFNAMLPYHERAVALRQEIVQHNLSLVASTAMGYGGDDVSDIIQEGNIGLMRAVDKFFLKKGWKFSTYAIWWIRSHIGRYLYTQRGIVRLPGHIREFLGKMNKFEEGFWDRHERLPTLEEFAAGLKCSKQALQNVFFIRGGEISLSCPAFLYDGKDADLRIDRLAAECEEPEQLSFDRDLSILISNMLARFELRERLIIELRFGLLDGQEHTLEEISNMLPRYGYAAVSRERVRQLEKQALRRIERILQGRELLAEYIT